MLGNFHLPRNALADIQVFKGSARVNDMKVWRKRPGASMIYIFAVGSGGNGGNGIVGANSAAAGGGGGASGNQTSLLIPAFMLPEILYVQADINSNPTRVTISSFNIPPTVNDIVVRADSGGAGGNAVGGTGGTAGAAASVNTIAQMPLAGNGILQTLAGQAGIVGASIGNTGAVLTLPTTGLRVTGGTGGGGVGAAGSTGGSGGAFTVAGVFPPQIGGIGSSAATTPPTGGSNGLCVLDRYGYFYGGTGGGATHGTATGAGLVGAPGGGGGFGCGGGGGGGALTGSTATNIGGLGGRGLVIIIQW